MFQWPREATNRLYIEVNQWDCTARPSNPINFFFSIAFEGKLEKERPISSSQLYVGDRREDIKSCSLTKRRKEKRKHKKLLVCSMQKAVTASSLFFSFCAHISLIALSNYESTKVSIKHGQVFFLSFALLVFVLKCSALVLLLKCWKMFIFL